MYPKITHLTITRLAAKDCCPKCGEDVAIDYAPMDLEEVPEQVEFLCDDCDEVWYRDLNTVLRREAPVRDVKVDIDDLVIEDTCSRCSDILQVEFWPMSEAEIPATWISKCRGCFVIHEYDFDIQALLAGNHD